jgi:uncharacterized protein YchJ
MTKKDYIRPRKWYYIEGKPPLQFTLGCCVCGVLHKVEFKKTKDGVAFRMWKTKQ